MLAVATTENQMKRFAGENDLEFSEITRTELLQKLEPMFGPMDYTNAVEALVGATTVKLIPPGSHVDKETAEAIYLPRIRVVN